MESETSKPGEGHLQRRMSRLTMVALTFAILNTWIALAGSLGLVLPSGGSVSFLYGFIFCVLCNFALGASLGEMAAIWPTAGGQYHFVFALAGERWRRVLSFWVGWVNITGWLTLVTTEGFFGSQFIAAAANMGSGGKFAVNQWETYLIFLAILTFGTLLNIYGNRILAGWNDFALYWSIFGVVVISIVVLSTSDKRDADFVFANFQNETGWSDGMSWILGLLQSALSLIGFDACLHMTEEMPRPIVEAPQAIMYAVAVGGVTGTVFIIVMLFCMADPTTILNTDTGMPITELIFQATKSRAAATVLTLMLAVCFVNGTMGCITSASRLTWAMARDRGIVFPEYFGHLSPTLNVPVRTIGLCFIFNVCFGLLYLGPTVAFSAYSASCTIFLNVSYALPVIVLLVRGRDVLREHQAGKKVFNLGRWGSLVNWIAAVFVVVTSIFFCFPTGLPVGGNSMNYVSVVIGIFLIVCSLFWIFYGKEFEGPKFDIIIGSQPSAPEKSAHVIDPKTVDDDKDIVNDRV